MTGNGESCDSLRLGGLKILQGRDGYRFSLDPVLLSAFVRLKGRDKVADLGCGAGILPLLLACREATAEFVGYELQPQMVARARRNVELNVLSGRIVIEEADVRMIRSAAAPETFSLVVSNPPYRAPDTGRQSPAPERARARHELAGGLDDFLAATAFLLKSGGRCAFVFLAERLGELLAAMRGLALEPKRLRCVHSRGGEPARLVLVEGRKNGGAGLVIEAPLYLYRGDSYSDEVLEMYGEAPPSI